MTSTVEKIIQTGREYLRVSVDRSGRQRSPEEQHNDNQRASDTRNWVLGAPYRDVGSASRHTNKRREDFDRLISDLRADRFGADVLILWESSRGSRRVSEWVLLLELCEERGVQIFVTSDGKLYDPADARDRRSLQEDSVDAEYESAKASKRTKRAAAATAAAGRPTGPVPYGFIRTYHPVTRKLVAQEERPDEAEVIRELFKRLHKGHSMRSIAMDFERRGIKTRTGKIFTEQHLRSLATSWCYAGVRVHDPDRVGNKLSPNASSVDAKWPALVDKRVFLAVQARLSAPERATTRPGGARHLLSQIIPCDVCSGPLTARGVNSDKPQYFCHLKGCVKVDYHELNRLVEDWILGWLSKPANIRWLTRHEDGGAALEAAQLATAKIQKELDDLADQVGAGLLTAMLAARSEPAIQRRLKQAQEHERKLSTPSKLSSLLDGPPAEVRARWRDALVSTQRDAVRMLLVPEILGELRVVPRPPGRRGSCHVDIEDRVIRSPENPKQMQIH